jgi:hypothetical protein
MSERAHAACTELQEFVTEEGASIGSPGKPARGHLRMDDKALLASKRSA